VKIVLPPGRDESNLDACEVVLAEARFDVAIVPFDAPALLDVLAPASVVLGGPHYLLPDVAGFCRARGIAYVMCTEYSLRTRLQIVRADGLGPLRALKRAVWEAREEAKTLWQVRRAAAIQCNGTPTFDLYRHVNREALLYFDNRVTPEMCADADGIDARLVARRSGAPIRLVFSGRFSPMKGADHVIEVARRLDEHEVPFTLDLFGGGPLEPSMRAAVTALGLDAHVRFHGVRDFATELMPFVREHADLFVCCHRQGDPSCTYVETFAAGVPIVGYANEALRGLLTRVDAGVSVPMDDPEALAITIAGLADDHERLARMSHAARTFARGHIFAPTFARRVAQLVALARIPDADPVPARGVVA
jgi:colanic acid/amylovoran biosynthesis glycosyltransferase